MPLFNFPIYDTFLDSWRPPGLHPTLYHVEIGLLPPLDASLFLVLESAAGRSRSLTRWRWRWRRPRRSSRPRSGTRWVVIKEDGWSVNRTTDRQSVRYCTDRPFTFITTAKSSLFELRRDRRPSMKTFSPIKPREPDADPTAGPLNQLLADSVTPNISIFSSYYLLVLIYHDQL